MPPKKKKPLRGRPKEGREPFWCHILPEVGNKIDGMIDENDRDMNSRGKIIESRFKNSVN